MANDLAASVDGRSFLETASLDTVLPVAPVRVSLGVIQDEPVEPGAGAAEAPDASEEATSFRGPRAGNFGDADTWRINFYGTGAFADGGNFYGAFAGLSYFLIDDLSLEFELGLLGFDQDGPDAWGGNFNLLLRWHFYSQSSWSIFIDAGAGFLKTNDDVPDSGSNYNFTPQAGAGFSFDIGGDWRLLAGVRWHHISNANLADENPGRDSIQVWAGLSIPF